ncbi:MAG TPA: chromate transporter [Anaerolineae bacterium]|nr:chromate transporter [Anaerolineae bacterium]
MSELARLFLRLGVTAFGGPAAHISMMRDEVVARRRWLTDQHFLDLLGATNLIPGPNSTEMAIHIGYVRAGWRGLLVAGACFVLPAMLIVTGLAWAYTQFGTTPRAAALLYGVQPVVIAIIAQALWGLGRQAIKGPLTALVGLVVAALYFANVDPIALLIAGGLTVMIVVNGRRLRSAWTTGLIAPLSGLGLPLLVASPVSFDLATLFFTFLKIGSVLYGSGYVLLAFLRAEFVERLFWLTDRQLLDAVAVGQVTPGPVFTTATFIGYVLGGLPGAIVATVGIFLPSFVFVAISNPFIPRLRQSPWAGSLLDGVNVASLGLMAAVTVQLAQAAFVDILSVALGVVALILLFRFKINSTWLVLGGALAGLLSAAVRG